MSQNVLINDVKSLIIVKGLGGYDLDLYSVIY
jgi:hypothetical protein